MLKSHNRFCVAIFENLEEFYDLSTLVDKLESYGQSCDVHLLAVFFLSHCVDFFYSIEAQLRARIFVPGHSTELTLWPCLHIKSLPMLKSHFRGGAAVAKDLKHLNDLPTLVLKG